MLESEISGMEAAIDRVGLRSLSLERKIAPGQGFISADQAMQRYQDAVYDFMVGQHGKAAESFFALVTTAALGDSGLHRDAEWYLAESLFLMGNLEIAASVYRTVADEAVHPFRDDAVRRLLEIYSRDPDSRLFDDLYEREILGNSLAASDLITYSVGKAFHTKRLHGKAKTYFDTLAIDSPYYARARYFMGAMLVEDGAERSLKEAVPFFSEILELSIETPEARKLYDLALLALGRIYYELEDYDSAAEAYTRIGGDSEFLDDKLNEIVWTFIKQGEEYVKAARKLRGLLARGEGPEDAAEQLKLLDKKKAGGFQNALRAVEIFLLAFPEHEYAAELQLVQGHLHFREVEFDSALTAYEHVIAEYAPVRDRFSDLAGSGAKSRDYFQVVLELDPSSSAYTPQEEGALPTYAVAMMMGDRDLSRAVEIYRDLAAQQDTVGQSEQLVEQIELAIGDRAGAGGFQAIRYDLILNQSVDIEQRVALLEAEERWLEVAAGGSLGTNIAKLRQRREDLSQQAVETAISVRSVGTAIETRDEQLRNKGARVAEVDLRRAFLERELSQGSLEGADRAIREAELADLEDEARKLERPDTHIEDLLTELEVSTSGALGRLTDDISALHAQYVALRGQAGIQAASDVLGERIDTLHTGAEEAFRRLVATQRLLRDIESTELHRIIERFRTEAVAVERQRADLGNTYDQAEAISTDLMRQAFGRLENFFADSVLGADMGVVNVYWSEWVDVGEKKEVVTNERNELIGELERRFSFLRQKFEQ